MLARKDIGRGQAHEAQFGSVGTPTHRLHAKLQPGPGDGFLAVVHDLGVLVQDHLHVAVLLEDAELNLRTGMLRYGFAGQLLEQGFLVGQRRGLEVADDELDRGLLDTRVDGVGVDEALVAVRGLGRE